MSSPDAPPAKPSWFKQRAFAVSAVAATFALAGMGTLMLQASAEPIDSNIAAKCALGTGSIDVTVPLTVDDKVDPVAAGGSETLVTKTGMPKLPVEATINKLVVTTPVPAQIASIDSVTFSGGNMKSAYTVSGSNVIVTFTGPVSSKDIDVPTVTAGLTVRADATGPINWKTFSEVDADTNYGMATCKPNNPDQVVNTTAVTGGSTSTTAPTTTAPAGTPTTTTAPSKPKGNEVSATATARVTAHGPNGGTSGSAPGMPSLPGVPGQPGMPTMPTPPASGLPIPPAPTLPTPAPSQPSGSCSTSLPITLPAPPAPLSCPDLPSAPTPPSSLAPGGSVSVTGSVTVTS